MRTRRSVVVAMESLAGFLAAMRADNQKNLPVDKTLWYRTEVMYALLMNLCRHILWHSQTSLKMLVLRGDINSLLTTLQNLRLSRLKSDEPVLPFTPGENPELDAYALESFTMWIDVYSKHYKLFLENHRLFEARQCGQIIEACQPIFWSLSRQGRVALKGEAIIQEPTIAQFADLLEWCSTAMLKYFLHHATAPNASDVRQHAIQFYVHGQIIRQLCSQGDLLSNAPFNEYFLTKTLKGYVLSETRALGISLDQAPVSKTVSIWQGAPIRISSSFKGVARKIIHEELQNTSWDAGLHAEKLTNPELAAQCRKVATACSKIAGVQGFESDETTLLRIKPSSI